MACWSRRKVLDGALLVPIDLQIDASAWATGIESVFCWQGLFAYVYEFLCLQLLVQTY